MDPERIIELRAAALRAYHEPTGRVLALYLCEVLDALERLERERDEATRQLAATILERDMLRTRVRALQAEVDLLHDVAAAEETPTDRGGREE